MAANLTSMSEYEEYAKEMLPKAFFEFVSQGTGHQDTLRNNLKSYKR